MESTNEKEGKKMFSIEHVMMNVEAKSKEEVLKLISKKATELGITHNEELLYKAFLEREQESCTGMQDGIAIPHAKSDAVVQPSLIFVSLKNELEWESLDDKPINTIFALLAPNSNGCIEHLMMLSKLATKLLEDSFVTNVKNAKTANQVFGIVTEVF